MRTCGECAWWDPNNDKEYGYCCAPAPMSFWDLWDRQMMNADADATACPCFKSRVCERCQDSGWVTVELPGPPDTLIYSMATGPCPACRKEER